MITTCNNDLGSHILYNGPCDVIGRRVFSFVTEELELQIKYFEAFDSTIRPIHCAILLRNVTILNALTEESRQVEQIKRKNDVCNEKTFQKNLHEKVTKLKVFHRSVRPWFGSFETSLSHQGIEYTTIDYCLVHQTMDHPITSLVAKNLGICAAFRFQLVRGTLPRSRRRVP